MFRFALALGSFTLAFSQPHLNAFEQLTIAVTNYVWLDGDRKADDGCEVGLPCVTVQSVTTPTMLDCGVWDSSGALIADTTYNLEPGYFFYNSSLNRDPVSQIGVLNLTTCPGGSMGARGKMVATFTDGSICDLEFNASTNEHGDPYESDLICREVCSGQGEWESYGFSCNGVECDYRCKFDIYRRELPSAEALV